MNKDWNYILNEDNLINESNILVNILDNDVNNIIYLYINNPNDYLNIIKIIKKNYIDYNTFYSIIDLFCIINKTKKISKAKKILNNYQNKLKNNNDFFTLLNYLNKCNLPFQERVFFEKYIKQYKNHKLTTGNQEKINKIYYYICKLNNELLTDLNNNNFHFEIPKKYVDTNSKINNINDDKLCFKINYHNYHFINNMITNNIMRSRLQNQFQHTSNKIINNFTKILILKHELAKRNGFNNYGEFLLDKSSKDFEHIEIYLKKFIESFTPNINNLFKKVCQELKLKKIYESDLRYWFSISKKKFIYSPNDIIVLLINVFNKFFGLTIIDSTTPNWNSNVISLNILNENSLVVGTIYLDLLKRNNKIKCPKTIILNDFFEDNGNYKLPTAVIVAGYDSLSEKILSIDDAIYLFKQFGFIIHHLVHKSNFGLNNVDLDLHSFMPILMEHLFLHFCPNIDSNITQIIKFEKIFYIFNISVEALFDLLIHTSEFFVNICKELAKDEKNLNVHMNKLYFNLYDLIMEKFKDNFEYPKIAINPHLLYRIINGDSCALYSNAFNNIMVYNLVQFLIDKNLGTSFRKKVLEPSNDYFRNLLNKFFEEHKIDSLKLSSILANNNNIDDEINNLKPKIIKEKINKISLF